MFVSKLETDSHLELCRHLIKSGFSLFVPGRFWSIQGWGKAPVYETGGGGQWSSSGWEEEEEVG